MFTQIIGMMTEAVTFVFDTFSAFVTGDFFYLFITMFVLVCVVRFLIIPIVGHGLNVGSDRVQPDVKAQQVEKKQAVHSGWENGQKPASDYPD